MESPRLPFLPAPLFSSTSSFYASRPPSSPLLFPSCSSSPPTPIFPSPPFNFFPPPPLLPPPTPPRSEEVWFPKSKWKNLFSGSRPFSSGTSYFLARSMMMHPSTSQQTAEVKKSHVILSFLCMISDFNFISPFHLENSLHFSHVLRIGDS